MKLRNKNTGEIEDVTILSSNNVIHGIVEHNDGVKCMFNYTVKQFADEWEDYEESKKVWFIDSEGLVRCAESEETDWFKENEIGNNFETKEEAEKAVKKLKAWKRLKDKGWRFERYDYDITSQRCIIFLEPKELEECPVGKTKADLDLLFGGEDA